MIAGSQTIIAGPSITLQQQMSTPEQRRHQMRDSLHTYLDDTLLRIGIAVTRMEELPNNLILGDIGPNMSMLRTT